jgi:polyisoprenoid-binding protein YceI
MNLPFPLSRAVLGAALVLGTQAALAQQQLVPAQSEVQFTARQMGVPLDGHFKKFSAQVVFDPAKLATSKIAFTVDTGSATLGSRETDAELPKPAWFNVPQFPQAQFESSSIKALGGGKFEVAGKLTIKGQTQNVVVPVALAQSLHGGRRGDRQVQDRADRRAQALMPGGPRGHPGRRNARPLCRAEPNR